MNGEKRWKNCSEKRLKEKNPDVKTNQTKNEMEKIELRKLNPSSELLIDLMLKTITSCLIDYICGKDDLRVVTGFSYAQMLVQALEHTQHTRFYVLFLLYCSLKKMITRGELKA
ncbi:hypothetical protein Hanom_Chr11g01064491 [Helianthus anomalus]